MFLSKGYKGTYYLYYKKDLTGKVTRISTKTKIKREANKFRDVFIKRLANSENEIIKRVIFFKELQSEVLKYTSNNLLNATVQIYKRVTNDFLKIVGDKPIKQITIQDIEQFKNERLKQVANMTVNIDLRTLRAVFNLAIKWSWLNKNPLKYVRLMSIIQKEKLSFNKSEIELIINNIEDISLKNFVLVGLLTGCRLDEICNIQLKDINLKERTLRIINKIDFVTKTKSIRNVPISNELYSLLLTMIKNENNVINFYNPDEYLFKNKHNIKFNKGYISKSFKKVLRKLNLPEKFHFHCLRHTFITQLIKNGVNINYVKEIAGHSDIKTTMRYAHVNLPVLQKTIESLEPSLKVNGTIASQPARRDRESGFKFALNLQNSLGKNEKSDDNPILRRCGADGTRTNKR